ncbi:M10 family metallopeptidase [Bradyrhizobium sp. CCBAU 51627]|uniref:M10 family metallopeptidase n=1 Tax=Bradyrhizobium sp. CCBAU 51627 TaxID=1325088 RepID=UPI0023063E8D|nr:M10 family metallopeptidase [Bradyrhizobium sp. CCBAU 51627]
MATAVNVSATNNADIDGLLAGTKWSGTISYSFPTSSAIYAYPYSGGDSEPTTSGFSAAPSQMQMAINYAIALIESFTNASITYNGTGSSDIMIAQSPVANPTSYAYYPGNYAAAGDVWFGTENDYTQAQLGNYYFTTALHELGHAFGLKHSQETGGVANVAVPTAHDDSEYTVMSYRSYVGGPVTGYTNEAYGYPQTYMANDILALQTLYGANYNTQSGNTVYTWSPTTGQEFINGIGQLAPGGGAGGSANRIYETVWDGGGIDTYDLSNYTTDLTINLNPGASSVFSMTQLAYLGDGHYASGNVYNAYLYNGDTRSLIDNATGGSGNDTIIGNAIANVLKGGGGNDTITGGGGNDTIDGGSGTDTAVYSGNRANYAVAYNSATQTYTIADQRAGSPDGTDTVTNVENFQFADGVVASTAILGPLVTAPDFTATHNQNIAASTLFTASDPNGYTITEYHFWDSTADPSSGHFVVGGVAQGTNQSIDVLASQLASTTFQSGSGSDDLWVQAFDGTYWSAWKEFHVNAPVDQAPVVSASDYTATHNQNIAASSLFTVSDAEGDPITAYHFWDSTSDPSSGHFVVGGVAQGTNQNINVSAAQLSSTTFQSGSGSDDLWVQAFDGTVWGAWKEFHVNAPVDQAPVVSASDYTATHNQNIAASSLFTVSDAEGDPVTAYHFWDSTSDPSSGHFVVGGVAQGANQNIDVSAAQLSSTTFQSASGSDDLWVQAFDGTSWGAWKEFHVNAPVDQAPVVSASDYTATHYQNIAASSLFTVSDAEGDPITAYHFWDSTSDPSSGHFVVGGVAQGMNQNINVSAAQLSSTTFQSGSGSDDLWVQAFDGTVWGAWKEFHVNAPLDHAPVVSASDYTATHNQNIATSSLFTVSDAEGDPVTAYHFWDSTSDPSSGHFVVGGVAQGANQNINVSAAQLSSTTFQSGTVSDDLWVQAFDGTLWGAWKEFHVLV